MRTLRADPIYERLFPAAFPGPADPFRPANISRALATFQRTLVSHNSPYDRYRYRGDRAAVSDAARRGERLFFGEHLGCFHCHDGFNFSDSVRQRRLTLAEIVFHNTRLYNIGLYNIGGSGNYPPDNRGIYDITGKPEDMGAFRTPTSGTSRSQHPICMTAASSRFPRSSTTMPRAAKRSTPAPMRALVRPILTRAALCEASSSPRPNGLTSSPSSRA